MDEASRLNALKPKDQALFYFRGTLRNSRTGIGSNLTRRDVGDQFMVEVNIILKNNAPQPTVKNAPKSKNRLFVKKS